MRKPETCKIETTKFKLHRFRIYSRKKAKNQIAKSKNTSIPRNKKL